MFGIEFRPVVLFGLVGVLLTWMVLHMLARLVIRVIYNLSEKTEEDEGYARWWEAHFQTVRWPGYGVILGVWLLLVVWAGWKASETTEPPQGVLVPVVGSLGFEEPKNSPDVAGERLKKEGRIIQGEGLEALDDWRQNFFQKREGRNDENNVSGDGPGNPVGLRDSGSTRQKSDPDARERGK